MCLLNFEFLTVSRRCMARMLFFCFQHTWLLLQHDLKV